VADSGAGELTRLAELVEWQRQELSHLRAGVGARSVTDLATGMLMERLGCLAAEAGKQLADLAAEAHVSVAELASEIASEPASALVADPASGARPEPEPGGLPLISAAGAPDAARIARALLDESLADEGVTAVAIWLIAPDGGLELAGEAGFGPQEAARWRRVPPGFQTAAQRAARDGTGVWWPGGRPSGDSLPLIGGDDGGARAVLPLESPRVSIGALELRWACALGEFSSSARKMLHGLADVCGRALTAGGAAATADNAGAWIRALLDGLHDSALIARPAPGDRRPERGLVIDWVSQHFADPAGRPAGDIVGRPLLEIYPEAARPGGLYDCARRVVSTGRPELLPAVVLTGAGTFIAEVRIAALAGGVAICWRAATDTDRLATLLRLAQQLGRVGCWQEDLRTGDVLWTDQASGLLDRPPGAELRLQDLDKHVLAEDVPAVAAFRDQLFRQQKQATATFRVMRAEDGSVRQIRAVARAVTGAAGEPLAVLGAYQDISQQLHAQIAFDATREQLTDAEQRAADEQQLAFRLQQAITPHSSELAGSAGLAVAARYRPAGIASLVSGDWYDAVVLPDKQVLVVVGDVAGHGLDAVTGMVALRNYLRGLAVTGASPARLLGWLNVAACQLAGGIFATSICALYDPAGRTLRWARAGHLPPLLIRDTAARSLPLPPGMVLGADVTASYSEAAVSLRRGDVLLLYTDGLVERRSVPLDDSLAELRQRASQRVPDIGRFADEMLASSQSDTGDDACLLAVGVR
jgi:serine phosphatase RsbU (regulator of sigma subunit)